MKILSVFFLAAASALSFDDRGPQDKPHRIRSRRSFLMVHSLILLRLIVILISTLERIAIYGSTGRARIDRALNFVGLPTEKTVGSGSVR
jgi:hypothetical protein